MTKIFDELILFFVFQIVSVGDCQDDCYVPPLQVSGSIEGQRCMFQTLASFKVMAIAVKVTKMTFFKLNFFPVMTSA